MTDTDIEAQINSMYALHNRIEAELIATYGPIEKWDTDYGIGLSDGQYKSLGATMAEWFIDFIKDEGMVRTPGTVEISRDSLAHILHIYELAQGSLFVDGEIAPGGEFYDQLVEAVDDERNVDWGIEIRAALAKEDKSIPLHPAIAFPVHGLDQSNAKQVDAINAAAEALYQTLSKEDTNGR